MARAVVLTSSAVHLGHKKRVPCQGVSGRGCRRVARSSVGHAGAGAAAGTNAAASRAESFAQQIINSALTGDISPEQAAKAVASYATGIQQVSDFAALDAFRADRTGFPEVVWGPGKTAQQLAQVLESLATRQRVALATRVDAAQYEELLQLLPDVEYNSVARVVLHRSARFHQLRKQPRLAGSVAVITAGTADLAVAEECRVIAEQMGCYTFRLHDMGVAGLHRILSNLDGVRAADVVIVIAGMDGSLAGVVAGLVETPVIVVPTSVGYGAALHGVTPLFASLSTEAGGVTVVNIDNGFGAAMAAARILKAATRLNDLRARAQQHGHAPNAEAEAQVSPQEPPVMYANAVPLTLQSRVDGVSISNT